jgi:hypothetical protein
VTVYRPLRAQERMLLDRLLSHDFLGVEALRQQAVDVTAAPGCPCGCGTLDLRPGPGSPPSTAVSPVPVEGELFEDGVCTGGLLLFVEGGLLSSLEVYSHGDRPPLPLPSPERVQWFSSESG